MSVIMRVKQIEQSRLDTLSFKINGVRLKRRLKPMPDTKIMHELISLAMDDVGVTDEGLLYLKGGNKDYRKLLFIVINAVFGFKDFNRRCFHYA